MKKRILGGDEFITDIKPYSGKLTKEDYQKIKEGEIELINELYAESVIDKDIYDEVIKEIMNATGPCCDSVYQVGDDTFEISNNNKSK